MDNNSLVERAPYTLSERMRDECVSEGMAYIDEVAALEAEIERAMDALFHNGWHPDDARNLGSIVEGVVDALARLMPQEISPTDTLKHNYEKLGLSSALVVNNKYGKRSAFGYMGRE